MATHKPFSVLSLLDAHPYRIYHRPEEYLLTLEGEL